jgi:aspartyl-tRNA synthetase
LNKIQQIAHEFQEEAMSFQPGSEQKADFEETFLLKEEILQCVESLSAKCLSQSAAIKLDTKCLPERLLGDA